MMRHNKLKDGTEGPHSSTDTHSNPATISLDVDKANSRAKHLLHQTTTLKNHSDRAKLFRSKHIKQPSNNLHHKSMDDIVMSESSITNLRLERKRQEEREGQMLSRLKYIEVEKERNIKTAQWAKRKYSLIVERRMENLQMRSMIGEGRNLIDRQNKQYVTSQKSKSRLEKDQREKKIKLWRSEHRKEADSVKKASEENQQRIQLIKQREIQNKRYKVLDVKKQETDIVKKKINLETSKKAFALKNHKLKLVEELELRSSLLRRNGDLFRKLAQKSQTVKQTYDRAQSQLQKLQQVLSTRRNLNSRTSNRSSRNSSSFFVTKH